MKKFELTSKDFTDRGWVPIPHDQNDLEPSLAFMYHFHAGHNIEIYYRGNGVFEIKDRNYIMPLGPWSAEVFVVPLWNVTQLESTMQAFDMTIHAPRPERKGPEFPLTVEDFTKRGWKTRKGSFLYFGYSMSFRLLISEGHFWTLAYYTDGRAHFVEHKKNSLQDNRVIQEFDTLPIKTEHHLDVIMEMAGIRNAFTDILFNRGFKFPQDKWFCSDLNVDIDKNTFPKTPPEAYKNIELVKEKSHFAEKAQSWGESGEVTDLRRKTSYKSDKPDPMIGDNNERAHKFKVEDQKDKPYDVAPLTPYGEVAAVINMIEKDLDSLKIHCYSNPKFENGVWDIQILAIDPPSATHNILIVTHEKTKPLETYVCRGTKKTEIKFTPDHQETFIKPSL